MAQAQLKEDARSAATRPSKSWDSLSPELSQWILKAVQSFDFDSMTPVQKNCIPLFLGNKDVVVEAVTGSGKTLAFLIPVIEKILRLDERTRKHHVAAVIVSPTNELARQIHAVLINILKFHTPSHTALETTGHADNDNDDQEEMDIDKTHYPSNTPIALPQLLVTGQLTVREDLSWFLSHAPNILIATPGRLLELLSSPHVKVPQSSFEVLVLDEADRLLDMGFEKEVQKIIRMLPKQRRTGLFSATVSEAVESIVRVGLRNPVKIAVKVRSLNGMEEQMIPASLQLRYIVKPASEKIPTVIEILSRIQPRPTKSIIYLSTCAAVEYWQNVLPDLLPRPDGSPYLLVPLHGKMQPDIRDKNFTRFSHAHNTSILLTTDVAARGLDIPQVDLVIQIDPPNDPKVFLHRCGRAGRAGRKGLSIILLHPGREEEYIDLLRIRKTPVAPFDLPPLPSSDATSGAGTTAEGIISKIRKQVLKDRALHDKAQKAFVSWVQSYKKHEAASIFRANDLDWEDLGRAWGLLKLPSMPELKNFDGDRTLGLSALTSNASPVGATALAEMLHGDIAMVDWKNYAYKNKDKEGKRQKELREGAAQKRDIVSRFGGAGKRKANGAWSQQLEGQMKRGERREKRIKKGEAVKRGKMNGEEKREQAELEGLVQKVRAQVRATGKIGAD